MKIIGLLLVATMATGQSAVAALGYDANRPIYDNREIAASVEEMPQVLARAYSAGRPVVIYVHGRGDEPAKSYDPKMSGGGALTRLEKEFGVTVVMINWNSKSSGFNRSVPLGEMPGAVANLYGSIGKLFEFRLANPVLAAPSLLAHSMGSIAVERMIGSHGWPVQAGQRLFSNVLLSEPDADSQGHQQWLEKLAATERVYVTRNRNDSVLQNSTDARNPATNFALGLDPVAPLAANATYVDLTEALARKRKFFFFRIGAHQIFRKSWMDDNVNTCEFVGRVLRGRDPEMANLTAVTMTGPGQYRFANNADAGHSCFKSTDSGGADEE